MSATAGDGSLWGYFLFIGPQSGRYTCFMITVVDRLREFMKNKARSCSMDFGCVNAVYVYRMWGGAVALVEIEETMKLCTVAGR